MPYKPATLAVENTSRLHQKHQKKASKNIKEQFNSINLKLLLPRNWTATF